MGGSLTLMIIVWIQKNDGLSDDLNVIVTARGRNGVFTVQLLCNYYGGVPSVKERKRDPNLFLEVLAALGVGNGKTYDEVRRDLKITDQIDLQRVRALYSGDPYFKNSHHWNREHVWPRSKMFRSACKFACLIANICKRRKLTTDLFPLSSSSS